jgi:hypothetical protein
MAENKVSGQPPPHRTGFFFCLGCGIIAENQSPCWQHGLTLTVGGKRRQRRGQGDYTDPGLLWQPFGLSHPLVRQAVLIPGNRYEEATRSFAPSPFQ